MKKREESMQSRTACITACSESKRFARAMKRRLGYSPPRYFLWSVEEEDEIWVTPDSPEWFDWLDGLSSFFFDGKDGDFTATARMETLRRTKRSRAGQTNQPTGLPPNNGEIRSIGEILDKHPI